MKRLYISLRNSMWIERVLSASGNQSGWGLVSNAADCLPALTRCCSKEISSSSMVGDQGESRDEFLQSGQGLWPERILLIVYCWVESQCIVESSLESSPELNPSWILSQVLSWIQNESWVKSWVESESFQIWVQSQVYVGFSCFNCVRVSVNLADSVNHAEPLWLENFLVCAKVHNF